MEVSFSPTFVRMFKTLPVELQEEVLEKIDLFSDAQNHKALKVHKLTGRLKDRFSFSVNYKIRIVFCYIQKSPKEAYLLAIGGHEIYDK